MKETNRRLRQRFSSFFSGLTGMLTGAAALIGAVVAILSAVGVIGGGGDKAGSSARPEQTTASWAAHANASACDIAPSANCYVNAALRGRASLRDGLAVALCSSFSLKY